MNAKKSSARLLRAAAKYTIEDISVEQITRTAEVSKPTFYRYYRDKYDLFKPDVRRHVRADARGGALLSWGEAMLRILENLERNLKFFQNGVKSNDQHSLRNYNMACISDAITDCSRGAAWTSRRTRWHLQSAPARSRTRRLWPVGCATSTVCRRSGSCGF